MWKSDMPYELGNEVLHSLLLELFKKIFGALSKDTYKDICKYFDMAYEGADLCSSGPKK